MRTDGHGREGARQPAEALQPAGAELAARLRQRRAEMEQAILARISDSRFSSAGREDAEYRAGLRAATRAALDYALAAVEGGPCDGLAEPAPAAALEQARRAARIGVGLDTVLRRYVAGYALLEEYIVAEVDRDPLLSSSTTLRDSLKAALEIVERLIGDVSEAYRLQVESARAGRPDVSLATTISAVDTSAASTRRSRPPSSSPRRERIMGAIVEVVAERGYAGASVGMVVVRAGVSRRTLYEVFPDGLDGGLLAVMDWALARSGELVSRRVQEASCWRDGLLGALAELLLFFDADRPLAQVCFVETMGVAAVREHREGNVRAFRTLLVDQLTEAGARVQPLAAEAVAASLMGMIYAHLAGSKQGPLLDLLGSLMSAAVMPFVPDERTALTEKARGEQLARRIQAGDPAWSIPSATIHQSAHAAAVCTGRSTDLAVLPAVLANRDARRARECLLWVAEHPDASNTEIAAGIGVAHRSQISRLLSELATEDLIVRRSEGVGRRNAWRLSSNGEEITRTLRSDAHAFRI